MWLFRLQREAGLDEVEGFVVSAATVREAREFASKFAGDEGAAAWLDPEKTHCRCIEGAYKEEMILRAFHAG